MINGVFQDVMAIGMRDIEIPLSSSRARGGICLSLAFTLARVEIFFLMFSTSGRGSAGPIVCSITGNMHLSPYSD